MKDVGIGLGPASLDSSRHLSFRSLTDHFVYKINSAVRNKTYVEKKTYVEDILSIVHAREKIQLANESFF